MTLIVTGEMDGLNVERVLATVDLDANSASDQNMYTCAGETLVTRLVFDNASASLLLAIMEAGFNAGVDDWQPTITLAPLTASGLIHIATPISGAARGAAASVLKAHFTTLAGAAATVRCRVIGIGG